MSWAEENLVDIYDPEDEKDWVTADGREMHFSEMETSHLLNCKRLLLRRLRERPIDYGGGGLDDSDMVQDAIASEVRHNEQLAQELVESIEKINLELESRRANQRG